MKKKLFTFVIAIALLFMLTTIAYAQSETVVDDADIFTDAEEANLSARIDEIREEYDFDITFITTDDTGAMTLKNYLDSHSALDLSRDGIVFGQDVTLREYHTTGRNYGVNVVSDRALDRIDEVIVPYLQDGDYYGAYDTYLDEAVKFLDAAATGVPYEGESLGATDFIIAVVIGLVGGGIIAFAVTASMKSAMNTARKKREAANYVRQGSFMLGQSNDRFLYENTTRTAKQKESKSSNNSRGGSGGGKY